MERWRWSRPGAGIHPGLAGIDSLGGEFTALVDNIAMVTHGIIQRRTRQPYGMEGGGPGAMGRNTWVKQPRKEDGDLPLSEEEKPLPLQPRKINIGGKASVWMGKGDRLLIETPGAGAWGTSDPDTEEENADHSHVKAWAPRGSLAEREAAQAGF